MSPRARTTADPKITQTWLTLAATTGLQRVKLFVHGRGHDRATTTTSMVIVTTVMDISFTV
jgi:hypothetical protein